MATKCAAGTPAISFQKSHLLRLRDCRHFMLIVMLGLTLVLTACTERANSPDFQQIPGSDPDEGQQALRDYGCGACHTIPGVLGATTQVGPPLNGWANRHYIAGSLPNNPDNLILWIRDPQAVEPNTIMPNLDVTEEDARHMSAYLYTLTR